MPLVVGLVAIVAVVTGVIFVTRRPQRGDGPMSRVRLVGSDRPFPSEGRYPSDPYIGSRACAECHPGEAAAHARSGHASTLKSTSRLAVVRRLDGTSAPDPEWPEVLWSYHVRDGELEISRKARGNVEKWVVDYVFGSGHHATTFVTMVDPKVPAVMEHRISYFTKKNSLGITPGHDTKPRPMGLTLRGGFLPPSAARECFRCHVTQLSAHDDQVIDPETMIPNVSCERCHGPGRAHVLAARRDAPEAELVLPFGTGNWTSESLLKLCGSCHRHPAKADPSDLQPDDPLLIRFQPVGIMQSKCYIKSKGAFSCVNCHDPHARISGSPASYNKVCLACHTGKSPPPADQAGSTTVTCPVSPRERCIDCHMPRGDAGQGILFSNHWIRIHRPADAATKAVDGETPR